MTRRLNIGSRVKCDGHYWTVRQVYRMDRQLLVERGGVKRLIPMPEKQRRRRAPHRPPRPGIHITCLECGVERRRLAGAHLRMHGMTTKDYAVKWPGAPMWAPDIAPTGRRKFKPRTDRCANSHDLTNRDNIYFDVWGRRQCLLCRRMPKRPKKKQTVAQRKVTPERRREIGRELHEEQVRSGSKDHDWTRDEAIVALKRETAKRGQPPPVHKRAPKGRRSGKRAFRRVSRPTQGTLERLFGTVAAAYEAAGLPAPKHGGHRKRQTHCNRGHRLTPRNVYVHGGRRHCRKCIAIRQKAYRERKAKR